MTAQDSARAFAPEFAGKVAIVTGAAHGFGRAITVELARRGARVAAVDVLEDELQETLALARLAAGPGAGAWARKVDVVRRALARHRPDPADPLGVLAAVGGLEHAALAGYLLGAAALRVPVILDGVIACAAALAAAAFCPDAAGCMIAGHRSTEPGASRALAALGLRPVLELDLRLGEGSGAVLALPVVQAAARVLRDVATFDSAGVSGKKE